MSTLKDVPELKRDGSNLSAVMQGVRETIQIFRGYRGDKLDRALTLRDLNLPTQQFVLAGGAVGGGVPGGSAGEAAGGATKPDLTPPPAATGFAVSAGIGHIYLSCDAPVYTQGHGHGRSVAYGAKWANGAAQPVFGDALPLFEFQGTLGAYPSDPSTRWCVWLKWKSTDGVLSSDPAGGVNGQTTTTGQDVSRLVLAMTGPGNPFKIVAAPITLPDGTPIPAGTYTADAFIHNGQIGNAMIAKLAVDDAKIASLSATKLTVGDGTVGGNLKSSNFASGSAGWLVQPNGNAEFQNAVIRGTVYATAGTFAGDLQAATGTFAGSLQAATGTFSGSLSAATGSFSGALNGASGTFTGAVNAGQFNTGAYTGYGWPAAGGTGIHIGPSGLLMGNSNASAGNPSGKYFQIYTPSGGLPAIYTNIPAYIESGQITNAMIGNAQITSAKIGALEVGTAHLAGNSVTVSSSVSGSATDIYASLYVPSGQTMRIVAMVTGTSSTQNDTINPQVPVSLTLNGVAISTTASGYVASVTNSGSVNHYKLAPVTLANQVDVTGPATVSVSANGVYVEKKLVCFGFMK